MQRKSPSHQQGRTQTLTDHHERARNSIDLLENSAACVPAFTLETMLASMFDLLLAYATLLRRDRRRRNWNSRLECQASMTALLRADPVGLSTGRWTAARTTALKLR